MSITTKPLHLPAGYSVGQIVGNILLAKNCKDRAEGLFLKVKLYDLLSQKEIKLNSDMFPNMKIQPRQIEKISNGNGCIIMKGILTIKEQSHNIIVVLNKKGQMISPIFRDYFPKILGTIIAAVEIGNDNYTVFDFSTNQKLLQDVQVKEIKDQNTTLALECTTNKQEKYVIANLFE